MALTSLMYGSAYTLKQNRSYAIPVGSFITASAAVDTSLDESTWTALAGATGGAQTGAKFIRSTGINTIVTCSRMISSGDGGGGGGGSVPDPLTLQQYLAIGPAPPTIGGIRLSQNMAVVTRAESSNLNLIKFNDEFMIEVGEPFLVSKVSGVTFESGWVNSAATRAFTFELFKQLSEPGELPQAVLSVTHTTGLPGGKHVLMVQFPTGAAIEIAREP